MITWAMALKILDLSADVAKLGRMGKKSLEAEFCWGNKKEYQDPWTRLWRYMNDVSGSVLDHHSPGQDNKPNLFF